jgi:hypothetical protein
VWSYQGESRGRMMGRYERIMGQQILFWKHILDNKHRLNSPEYITVLSSQIQNYVKADSQS